MNYFITAVSLTYFIGYLDCAKILGLTHFVAAPSHLKLTNTLLEALAERGHEVVSIGAMDNTPRYGKFEKIVVAENAIKATESMDLPNRRKLRGIREIFDIYKWGYIMNNAFISDKKLKEFLSTNRTFDLVIINNFIGDALLSIAHHFRAPVIAIGTFGANTWTYDLVGNPNPFASVPFFITGFTDRMNLYERTVNTMYNVFDMLYRKYIYYPELNAIIQRNLPLTPPVQELIKNVSLVLVNSHFSLRFPQPLMPNMIEIGGYHVKKPKEVSEELLAYLDNSVSGVILFSFGSMTKCKDIPMTVRTSLLNVFEKLPQNILWKCELDIQHSLKNLRLEKWIPQENVLAHPNTKLFISHSGFLSLTEAAHYGVPMLGIPFFTDQYLNIKNYQKYGGAIYMNFDNITTNSLNWALGQLLYNPKYFENAKKQSRIFHDRPLPPMDTAVYWCEYVIRHRGAPHLQSTLVNMPLYVYLLLDIAVVILVGLIIITLLLYYLYFIIKSIVRQLLEKRNKRKVN